MPAHGTGAKLDTGSADEIEGIPANSLAFYLDRYSNNFHLEAGRQHQYGGPKTRPASARRLRRPACSFARRPCPAHSGTAQVTLVGVEGQLTMPAQKSSAVSSPACATLSDAALLS